MQWGEEGRVCDDDYRVSVSNLHGTGSGRIISVGLRKNRGARRTPAEDAYQAASHLTSVVFSFLSFTFYFFQFY